jgi:hypothetical protein
VISIYLEARSAVLRFPSAGLSHIDAKPCHMLPPPTTTTLRSALLYFFSLEKNMKTSHDAELNQVDTYWAAIVFTNPSFRKSVLCLVLATRGKVGIVVPL